MKPLFGILAITVGIGAAVPYIRSILKGTTKPHRTSWLIWMLLSGIAIVTQLEKGARWSVLLATASLFNNTLMFVLGLKHGVGGTTKKDIGALIIALLGIVFWAVTNNAFYALIAVIMGDAIGTFLTVEKAYLRPETESMLSWSMAFIASFFGLLAVKSYVPVQTIQPLYSLLGATALTSSIVLGKKRESKRS
jgi:hypothetical protein